MALDLVIEEYLERAKLFHNFVLKDYPKGYFSRTLKDYCFISLCDLALEHHGAIITLVETGQHYGSAFALLRPLVETILRACWTLFLADEKLLKEIGEKQAQFPSLTACKKQLEQLCESKQTPPLFLLSKPFVDMLHGLTHSGMEQVLSRFDSDLRIKSNFNPATVCGLLEESSKWLAIIATVHLVKIEGDSANPEELERMALRYRTLFEPNAG